MGVWHQQAHIVAGTASVVWITSNVVHVGTPFYANTHQMHGSVRNVDCVQPYLTRRIRERQMMALLILVTPIFLVVMLLKIIDDDITYRQEHWYRNLKR
jgi:preprotein translocase subunit SecF